MGPLAVFVSPHGFGHAARACAIMGAIRRARPGVGFEIFTLVPRWFFVDSLGDGFRHHPLRTDVGLVQRTTLHEDPEATAQVLARFVPFDAACVATLAELLGRLRCRAVMADVSPLGIEVGRAAGLPVVLVENFVWSWVYRAYLDEVPALGRPVELLEESFARATRRVRCEPVCGHAAADLVVGPVSRRPRSGRAETRRALGVPEKRALVVVTMGGTPWRADDLAPLRRRDDVSFVIPGGAADYRTEENVQLLPHRSRHFHPDLIAAADAVVGKVGYSTVAEAFHAGVPLGFVPRERFPESPWLERFIATRMSGVPISEAEASSSSWASRVDELLALPRCPRESGGADAAGELVLDMMDLEAGVAR